MANKQHAQFSDENGNIYYLENQTEDVLDPSGKPLSNGGDLSEASVKFTTDSTRKLPISGGRFKAFCGSVVKFLSDIKTVGFTGSYNDLSNKPSIPSGAAASQAVANNCTTTAAGSVLDARQGKVLMDKANQLSSEISQTKKDLSGWEDITEKCNFGYYTSVAGNTGVYKNISLRIVCFRIALTASVSNQSVIATIGELPKNSHPIMLVGSCTHETEGVSVDMRMGDGYGDIISSHTKNVQISNPRYTGIILF